jgi:hypothetical protein
MTCLALPMVALAFLAVFSTCIVLKSSFHLAEECSYYMIAESVDFIYVSTNLDSYGTNKSNFIPDQYISVRKMFIRIGGVIVLQFGIVFDQSLSGEINNMCKTPEPIIFR